MAFDEVSPNRPGGFVGVYRRMENIMHPLCFFELDKMRIDWDARRSFVMSEDFELVVLWESTEDVPLNRQWSVFMRCRQGTDGHDTLREFLRSTGRADLLDLPYRCHILSGEKVMHFRFPQ